MIRALPLLVVLLAALASAGSISAATAATKLTLNSDSFVRGVWRQIVFDAVDFDDAEAAALDLTSIAIPDGATRGRCSFQASVQIPLPKPTRAQARITRDGGSEANLPADIIGVDVFGVWRLSGSGPWFQIGDAASGERFKIGDSLRLEVFVAGNPLDPDPFADAQTWLECEWQDLILVDSFEPSTSAWSLTVE